MSCESETICDVCGETFQRSRAQGRAQKRCSDPCRAEAKRRQESERRQEAKPSTANAEIVCDICGTSFRCGRVHGHVPKRCSDPCRAEADARRKRLLYAANPPEIQRSEAFEEHLIWLGNFPARKEGRCQGCKERRIERSCAWLFHGEVALLHLCIRCTAHVTTGSDRAGVALPPARAERTASP